MKLKLFELVQQLEYIKIEDIEKVLGSRDSIKDYAYIIHDSDLDKDGNLKAPHVHLTCRLKDAYDTKYICKWFGIKEQYICRVKGSWSDMLQYLIHENAPEKFQYSVDDVVSNFDFENVKNKEKENNSFKKRENDIINLIADGTIREYNYYNYITPVEFNKFSKAINNAFKYRADKLSLERLERNMECIYVCGKSGSGKTTYAKKICKDKNFSYFVSSSSNDVLDGYKGQDVIILDDLRSNCMGVSDLLKLLDNNTSSTVKSRYKNKFLECKMVIITSVFTIEQFYNNIYDSAVEPIEQLKRRCKTYIKLEDKKMFLTIYDNLKHDYGKIYFLDNPVYELIKSYNFTDKERLSHVCELLNIDCINDDELLNVEKCQTNIFDN